MQFTVVNIDRYKISAIVRKQIKLAATNRPKRDKRCVSKQTKLVTNAKSLTK